MSALVYVLRQSTPTHSHALYRSDDRQPTVVLIRESDSDRPSIKIAELINPGTNSSVEEPLLNYGELLEVLIKAGKVITL